MGRKFEDLIGLPEIKGNANKATNTSPIARTPPVLFGILRKIQ
jgi:hypothetical protein